MYIFYLLVLNYSVLNIPNDHYLDSFVDDDINICESIGLWEEALFFLNNFNSLAEYSNVSQDQALLLILLKIIVYGTTNNFPYSTLSLNKFKDRFCFLVIIFIDIRKIMDKELKSMLIKILKSYVTILFIESTINTSK